MRLGIPLVHDGKVAIRSDSWRAWIIHPYLSASLRRDDCAATTHILAEQRHGIVVGLVMGCLEWVSTLLLVNSISAHGCVYEGTRTMSISHLGEARAARQPRLHGTRIGRVGGDAKPRLRRLARGVDSRRNLIF